MPSRERGSAYGPAEDTVLWRDLVVLVPIYAAVPVDVIAERDW